MYFLSECVTIDIKSLIRKHTEEIFEEAKSETLDLFSVYESKNLMKAKSKKQLSEDISGLFGNSVANTIGSYGWNTEQPHKDGEPDVIIESISLEIKVTSGEQWRGGSFSKRSGLFMLISWGLIDDSCEFFSSMINMEKDDWISQMKKDNPNYYATFFGKKELVNHGDYEVIRGKIYEYKRGKQICVKMEKE
jgi:hypothetical protein